MALIKCPECGREISDRARSCPSCGYAISATKFCKHCGSKIPEDSVVCVKCGRQVESIGQNGGGITINNSANSSASASAQANHSGYTRRAKEINKWTALILCIFFGYLGVHKFYEGRTGLGILYLCTLGLFGIGWIVDIIIIAMKENPYYVY
ncbi:MAG: TM2 domain-containing protein [Ruminococcus flavefaciens]|nr:TM2 domain-containing protein [Ruminococcus flavefaciens]